MYIRLSKKLPIELSPYSWNIQTIRDEFKKRLIIFKEYKDTGWVVAPNIDVIFTFDEGKPIRVKTIELSDGIGARDDGINSDSFAIAVGDGYTFCDGLEIEDCWTEIIEKRIGKDVLNAGVSGYGTYQQYILLKKILEKFRFKIILWQVTYVDYLKDMCFISRQNCNIFSPNIAFLNNIDGILNSSSIYGLMKTLSDIKKTKSIYKNMRTPELKYIQEIQDYCLYSGCSVLVVETYKVPYAMRSNLCRNFKCLPEPPDKDKYFFKNKHLSPDGNRYLAESIIEVLKQTVNKLLQQNQNNNQ